MRFYLFDVDENREYGKHAKRATGKNDFSSLAHAKKWAEKTHGKLKWTSQDNLNSDQSITKWYFGVDPKSRSNYPVTEIRHATKKGTTPVKDEYILKNPIGKTATSIRPVNGWTAIKYHDTDVVSFSNGKIVVLDSGTWKTPTTKRRMNETADEFDLGFRVYAKKGQWYIDTPYDGTIEFFDGVRFQGKRASNPKRKRKVAKKRRTAKQIAATRKLVAFNKKRRATGRKKYTRTKRATKKTRRNPQKARPGLRVSRKKSHLWFAFVCDDKKVQYAYISDSRSANVGITSQRGAAAIFQTKTRAKNVADILSRLWKTKQAGVASINTSAAKIKAACNAGK